MKVSVGGGILKELADDCFLSDFGKDCSDGNRTEVDVICWSRHCRQQLY